MNKSVFLSIKFIQSTGRCHPNIASMVFYDVTCKIITEAFWVGVIFINRKGISIIFVKPFVCSKPHKAVMVFEDRCYVTLRQSFVRREPLEFWMVGLSISRERR